MDENYVVMIGAIGDLQLVRPGDMENFLLSFSVVSPPEHNETLTDALEFLAKQDGVVEMALYIRPMSDG